MSRVLQTGLVSPVIQTGLRRIAGVRPSQRSVEVEDEVPHHSDLLHYLRNWLDESDQESWKESCGAGQRLLH